MKLSPHRAQIKRKSAKIKNAYQIHITIPISATLGIPSNGIPAKAQVILPRVRKLRKQNKSGG